MVCADSVPAMIGNPVFKVTNMGVHDFDEGVGGWRPVHPFAAIAMNTVHFIVVFSRIDIETFIVAL